MSMTHWETLASEKQTNKKTQKHAYAEKCDNYSFLKIDYLL